MRFTLLLLVFALLLTGCPAERAGEDAGAAGIGTTALPPPGARNADGSPVTVAATLPVDIQFPAGAVQLDEGAIRGQLRDGSSRLWSLPFAYGGGFSAAAAAIDSGLAAAGYERLRLNNRDVDPGYTPGQRMKPTRAQGLRTYIAPDRTVMVQLRYTFTRGEDGAADQEQYLLLLQSREQPWPLSPHATTEPIE